MGWTFAVEAAERSTPLRSAPQTWATASSGAVPGSRRLRELSYAQRALRNEINRPARNQRRDHVRLHCGTPSRHGVDAPSWCHRARSKRSGGEPSRDLTHVVGRKRWRPSVSGIESVPISAATRAKVGAPSRNPTGLAVSPGLRARVRRAGPRGRSAAAQEAIALTPAGASDGVIGIALAVAAELIAPSDRTAALSYCRDRRNFREVGAPLDLGFAVWSGVRSWRDRRT